MNDRVYGIQNLVWVVYGWFVRRAQLAEARKAVGKSQLKVAGDVSVDRQTVGAWERGESTPHPHQREAYAASLNVSLSELAGMLSSMPVDAGEVPAWLATYLAMEGSATEIRTHEPMLIDGLLQTPGYVEAVVRGVGLAGVTDEYVRQNIDQRIHRQERVRDGKVQLEVIQAQQVLHVMLGDAVVMAEQLHALADAAELPNVTVRVMPFDAGQHEARRLDSFSLMSPFYGNPTLFLKRYGGNAMITDADEVSYFVEAYEQAAKLALTPSESIDLIRERAQEWESRR